MDHKLKVVVLVVTNWVFTRWRLIFFDLIVGYLTQCGDFFVCRSPVLTKSCWITSANRLYCRKHPKTTFVMLEMANQISLVEKCVPIFKKVVYQLYNNIYGAEKRPKICYSTKRPWEKSSMFFPKRWPKGPPALHGPDLSCHHERCPIQHPRPCQPVALKGWIIFWSQNVEGLQPSINDQGLQSSQAIEDSSLKPKPLCVTLWTKRQKKCGSVISRSMVIKASRIQGILPQLALYSLHMVNTQTEFQKTKKSASEISQPWPFMSVCLKTMLPKFHRCRWMECFPT